MKNTTKNLKTKSEVIEIFPYFHDNKMLSEGVMRNPYNHLGLYGERKKEVVDGNVVIVDYLYNLQGDFAGKKVIEEVRTLNNSINISPALTLTIIGTFVLGILSVTFMFA